MLMHSFALTNRASDNITVNIIHNARSYKMMFNQFKSLISISMTSARAVMIELQKLTSNSFLMRHKYTVHISQDVILDKSKSYT